MSLEPEYLDAIKGFEGYAAQPAWDYKQNSSGYGTKAQPGDENIPPDQLKAVHEQRFQDEVAKAAAHVDSVNPNLPQGVKAALTSLTYNAGPGWVQSGLGELVRKGDLEGAQARLLEYNKAGGEVNQGLVARRQKEAAWFGGGQSQPVPVSPVSPPTPQQPLQLQSAGLFNPAPQVPPIFAQQAAPIQVPQAEMAQVPPIFYPQRRSPDLSKLRAAFQPSSFYRG